MEQTSPGRIASLDVLRGFALLGILLMNIQSFTMPGAAYLNPTAYGDLTGANYWVWSLSHLFADQKFMSLFSMLFGAGMLIFTQNLSQKGYSEAGLHFRRMGWLWVFGLVHGYLFWYGDILFSYALCGCIIFWFRKRSAKTLFLLSGVFLTIGCLMSLATGVAIASLSADALKGVLESWKPDANLIQEEIAAYTGGFVSAVGYRWEETLFMQTYVFLTLFVWRATGMMLLGMALYKSGFFSLTWKQSHYVKLAVAGGCVGVALIVYGLYQHHQHAFHVQYSMFLGNQYNYWGSLCAALAYASLIMLWMRTASFSGIKGRLSAVGKTAFSNYILHTIIGVAIAIGLGQFGAFSRVEQFGITLCIWILQLWLSPIWLTRFKFGPLEWLWRCLTYWQIQRFSREPQQSDAKLAR